MLTRYSRSHAVSRSPPSDFTGYRQSACTRIPQSLHPPVPAADGPEPIRAGRLLYSTGISTAAGHSPTWRIETSLPTEPALLAVHSKLMRFLKDVKLSDLVLPGLRIDVPVEMVRRKNPETKPKNDVAALAAMT